MDETRKGMTFIETLRELEWGAALAKVDEAWTDVARGVAMHSKAGELTVKLKLNPAKDDPNRVDVSWDLKATVPEEDRVKMIAYVLPGGAGISRRDSRQPELPLTGDRPKAVGQGPAGPTYKIGEDGVVSDVG